MLPLSTCSSLFSYVLSTNVYAASAAEMLTLF